MFIKKRKNSPFWYRTLTEYLFYLFLFLLPWQTRYIVEQGYLNGGLWEYGTFSLYGTDILLLVIFILAIFYHSHIGSGKSRLTAMFLPFLAFLLIAFLSLYWASNQETAFYYWLRLLGVAILLFIILKININFRKAGASLVLAGLVQAELAIFQFFQQNVFSNKWLGMSAHSPDILGDQVVETLEGRYLRAYGSLPHPNILAGFLVLCLFLLIFFYLTNRQKYQKIFCCVALPILSAGLFFTFCRAAFIGFGVAWLFAFLFIFWKQKNSRVDFLKLTVFIAFVFSVLTIIYPSLIFSRVGEITRLEKKSIAERASFQKESLEIIKNNWPTGVGLGNYTQYTHDNTKEDLKSFSYQPVHNIYLLITSELGIFGFIIFILIIIGAFQKFNFKKIETIVAGVSVIAMLVAGFFDHYFFTLSFGLWLFWLPLGLLYKAQPACRSCLSADR